MKKILLLIIICITMFGLYAQEVIKLNGNDTDYSEMTIYTPEKGKDKKIGIVICPGGGYQHLAMQHEGFQFAQWLASEGYTAFVLKYRMPDKQKEIPYEDVSRAIAYIRAMSDKWKLHKVGVAGFSAGGHLAATASTQFLSDNVRPDFSILFYPVISMGEYTHKGSKSNLLGDTPSEKDIKKYSLETQVTINTPPTILLLSDDDKSVPSMNSILYYQALKEKNIPATMYIFPTGGHGWGMRAGFIYHKEMLSLLKRWLEETIIQK